MRRGAFEDAWRISDRVLHARRGAPCHHLPRHEQYIWDGSPLAGRRVLVRCYHGLGDTLQFIRYLPLVAAVAAKVTVWVQPGLIPLLERTPDMGRLLPLHDGEPGIPFDVDVELQELPHVFRSTLEDLPAAVPYLHVDPAPLDGNGRLKVGLAWRAGDWAPHRSIPFERLAPLTSQPVSWVVLQGEPGVRERPDGFGVVAGTRDLLDAARVTAALDLMITVDTMNAHLAGALGVPTWTLLPAESDWRWMIGRDDTPWYPTMRLFRQARAGEWDPVVGAVAAALARVAGAREPA